MARIYEQYMTGTQRDLAILEAEDSLFNEKVQFMLDTINRQLEINKKEAEYMVLKESGTYEDLEYLYMEAEAEAKQQTNGVLATIGNAITSIIDAIVSAVSGFFGKLNPNSKVKVDKEGYDACDAIEAAFNKAQGKPWQKIIAAASAIVTIFGGLYMFKKKKGDKDGATVEVSASEAEGKYNRVKKIFDEVKKHCPFLTKQSKDDNGGEVDGEQVEAGFFKNSLHKLQGFVSQAKTFLVNTFKGLTIKGKDQENNNEGQPTQNAQGQQAPQQKEQPATPQAGNEAPNTESAIDAVISDADLFIESLFNPDYDEDEDDFMEESVDDALLDEIEDLFNVVLD